MHLTQETVWNCMLSSRGNRCWREFLRCYSVSQKTTGPMRQCSCHSVNVLVQRRGNGKIMLLINTEHKLTALTALVLWRNDYCLRTKMYILAHDDVSVDNSFFFPQIIIIIFYLTLSLKNLNLYVKKRNWNGLTWSRPILSSYTNTCTHICICLYMIMCKHTHTHTK